MATEQHLWLANALITPCSNGFYTNVYLDENRMDSKMQWCVEKYVRWSETDWAPRAIFIHFWQMCLSHVFYPICHCKNVYELYGCKCGHGGRIFLLLPQNLLCIILHSFSSFRFFPVCCNLLFCTSQFSPIYVRSRYWLLFYFCCCQFNWFRSAMKANADFWRILS